MDLQKFYDGQEFSLYEFLGAHVTPSGVVFRTYAPSAREVSVIGAFNGWRGTPMHRILNGQFFEAEIAEAKPGQMYKFQITSGAGTHDHADPYAFSSQLRPETASIIWDMDAYRFRDGAYMKRRRNGRAGMTGTGASCVSGLSGDRTGAADANSFPGSGDVTVRPGQPLFFDKPLNIYELHLGSWKRRDDPEELARKLDEAKEKGEGIDVSSGWYRYEEIADLLVPYLKENHFNAVEFMPLNEYPADESWGYQATGFFSATSRYGTPDGLKKLVDRLHQADISVILDIVTVHFATNDYALARYDGTQLYEYPNDAVNVSEWGSCNFNHSRGDIASFLNSASAFWLDKYHFDGLRFDAVGNLIYWMGDERRGVNTNTVEFLKKMNSGLKRLYPDTMLIAEDSSAYPGVTKPVPDGGLGFDYKWDMGWMNDTLNFFRTDPPYRRQEYHKLTFSMAYFYNERYLLPLSHDEVVHGKATIIQKMAGDYDRKFPQARALYLYMFLHPGKKLNFMGNEFAQFREWDEKRQQDFMLLKYPVHDAFHRYFRDLSALYLKYPALWQEDYVENGFHWLSADDTEHVVYAFERRTMGQTILCVFNLSDQRQEFLYREEQGAARAAAGSTLGLQLLIDSDDERYGGRTRVTEKIRPLVEPIELPPFTGRAYLEVEV